MRAWRQSLGFYSDISHDKDRDQRSDSCMISYCSYPKRVIDLQRLLLTVHQRPSLFMIIITTTMNRKHIKNNSLTRVQLYGCMKVQIYLPLYVFVRMLDSITAGSVSSDLNVLKCDPEDASQGWKCSSSRAVGLKKWKHCTVDVNSLPLMLSSKMNPLKCSYLAIKITSLQPDIN